MKQYNKLRSSVQPEKIEITPTSILINSNIDTYSEEIDGKMLEGYEYEAVEYSKDEYLIKLIQDNNTLQNELINTQLALCELYESLEGGDING